MPVPFRPEIPHFTTSYFPISRESHAKRVKLTHALGAKRRHGALNVELSRSRRRLSIDEASEQRISHRAANRSAGGCRLRRKVRRYHSTTLPRFPSRADHKVSLGPADFHTPPRRI